MKRCFSLLLVFVLLLGTACTAFAVEAPAGRYPYIFVHGMMGWGENAYGVHETSYWGMPVGDEPGEYNDLLQYLRGEGFEAFAPSVGPLSSAWDRACELYAQLCGTRVDYGEAHSKKFGHERYGRDYTGHPIMGRCWSLNEKINLISHSFGGPAVTVFASLMSFGSEAERTASGQNCSPLFEGGHAEAIHSISTLASPHNGSPLANLLYDTRLPMYAVCAAINLEGTKKDPTTDFMLDQWGVTADPSTGKVAKLNPVKIIRLASSDDNCAYDMSIQGAKQLAQYKIADSIYLFSYATCMTATDKNGKTTVPSDTPDSLAYTAKAIILLSRLMRLGSAWAPNDGMVPTVSSMYPSNAENNHIFYEQGMDVHAGTWYVMPIAEGSHHGYHIAGERDFLFGFYDGLTALVDSLH